MEINDFLPFQSGIKINPSIESRIESKDTKALREQSNAFEALVLKHMLDFALNMEDSLYEKGAGSEIYNSMYKESIANALSGSFGYGDLLFNYLKEKQKGNLG